MFNQINMVGDRPVWIAAASVAGIGFKTLQKCVLFCVENGLTLTEWWAESVALWRASGCSQRQCEEIQTWQQHWTPEAYLEYLAEKTLSVVTYHDSAYPELLHEIADPPAVLFYQGALASLATDRNVGIVGTRHMTVYGKTVTTSLVADLVAYGCTIISGGMYGVDFSAHQAAVAASGTTVAVLGYGHDHVAAQQLRLLRDKILESGALVSEYPPWFPPNRGTFPARNRIVAGLSQVVVVTEAGWQSGSHITAELAAEYGREVCAVAGAVTNPMSDGTIKLVNQGAHLIRHAQDIAELLGWSVIDHSVEESELPADMRTIYTALAILPATTTQLLHQFEWPVSRILATVTELQLRGLITQYNSVWGVTRRMCHNGYSQ